MYKIVAEIYLFNAVIGCLTSEVVDVGCLSVNKKYVYLVLIHRILNKKFRVDGRIRSCGFLRIFIYTNDGLGQVIHRSMSALQEIQEKLL